MNGEEIIDVLKQIRDEAKQTNVRLESLEGRVEQTNVGLKSLDGRVEQTNVQLESLEGRVDFVERRLSKGFEELSGRIDSLGRMQGESELRLATEVLSLADVTRQVRDVIVAKLDDHRMVVDHEGRIRSIESRIADRSD